MNKMLLTCLACLLPATALAASGELWEITTKTEMPGMPFAMPASTMQVCMNKGDATDPRKSSPPDKDCKITNIKRSGHKTTWKMRCNRDGEIMTGTGEITTNAKGYKGVTKVKGTSGGHKIDMTSHFSGKKLGKSCDVAKQSKQMEETQKQAAQQRKNGKDSDDDSGSMGDKLKGMFGF